MEKAEALLKNILGLLSPSAKSNPASPRDAKATGNPHRDHVAEEDWCVGGYLKQARALFSGAGRKMEADELKCRVSVKVFGNELSVFTCRHLAARMSLGAAGLALKLLKGQEVQLNHRAALLTEELLLPSLSGLPVKIAANVTSFLSLRLKGNINYRDMTHFSVDGYIKPSAYVSLSARMGVDGALGSAAVDWRSQLVSSTSLDGSVHMQEGQDLRVTLNTPENVMDIMSLSSRVFQLSGDHREEMRGPKSRVLQTACTPKTWSKMVGWQLCANASYPAASGGISLPPSGPTHFSVRLLKLDRGLHYYLLEAAYSMVPPVDGRFPKEASIHLLMATPKSSIPRDTSLDLAFNPRRFLLRVSHPLKSILIEGQLEREPAITTAKLELMIDGVHYYLMGLADQQTLISELRTRYHVEAKMSAEKNPIILSANVTHGLGRRMSFSATVKNVFTIPASFSVSLERRRDSRIKQYSLEAELLLPGLVGGEMLGLLEQKGALWSSALRLKYGLGAFAGDSRRLRQECYTSQSVKSERHANFTYTMRAHHEFSCSDTPTINHKIHLKHEESPGHVRSSADVSYGKHWDEMDNKNTLLWSQSFKNQSTQNRTSYIFEFNFQVPQKDVNYRAQLLHSYLRQVGSESSTHLKLNYNDLAPLVAGLHWKSPPNGGPHEKWEGTFTTDTPWLYISTSHELSRHRRHGLRLRSELTADKWLRVRNLVLEASYRDGGREKEARLRLGTPAVTFLQVGGLGAVGKKTMKGSCSFSSLWTAPLRGHISLETLKSSLDLQMSSSYGERNLTVAAALHAVGKVLKKRQATLKLIRWEPESGPAEFELEGTVEELMKDKKMYQTMALLHLKQPLEMFPQKLLLRKTFTVDFLKGLYVLESRAASDATREIIHTLTIGYKLPSPFLCTALIHPYRTETIPSDSEICLNTFSNQTQEDIHGKLRVGTSEKLSFFGQILYNPLQVIKFGANITHQLQLPIPSVALVEGDVSWSPQNSTHFDHSIKGRMKIERQECQLSMRLNGTSRRILLYSFFRHPFKFKIPKSLEMKASADVSTAPGGGSSSVGVKVDEKERLMLDAHICHWLLLEDKVMLLRFNLTQSLLPGLNDLRVKMAANVSKQSVWLNGSYSEGRNVVLTQVKGSLQNNSGLQLALSGNLNHSVARWAILPRTLGFHGTLERSDVTIRGHVRVTADETFYCMDLRHREEKEAARSQMCLLSEGGHFCINASGRLEEKGLTGEVHVQLAHSSQLLNATGLPTGSGVHLTWNRDESRTSLLAQLRAGRKVLKAELVGGGTKRWQILATFRHNLKALQKRGISGSVRAVAHCQIDAAALDAGLLFHTQEQKRMEALFVVGRRNRTALVVASLWQQMELLQGILPATLQMNCTGDAAEGQLSTRCYGELADDDAESLLPSQMSMNISVSPSGSSTNLRIGFLAQDEHKGSIAVSFGFQPCFSVDASFRHSVEAIRALGVPSEAVFVVKGSRYQSGARFTVDSYRLLDSGVNVSWVDGRLAALVSFSPSLLNQTWKRFNLNTALTTQFKGPLRSISVHAQTGDRRLVLVADVEGWGLRGASKEGRLTLKQTRDGDSRPALQAEAWGRLSHAQLKCSLAVNPELASSLAVIIQGHRLPNGKELLVKVVQSIPQMQIYLPSHLNFRSQLNQSQSGVGTLVELVSGKRRLWTLGELAPIDGGYRQSLELKHSYPQLKLLPRTVRVRTVYEAKNWTYLLQHGALFGKQEFTLAGLYAAPPSLEDGNQTLKVEMKCRPSRSSLEVTLERFKLGRLDSVSLGWMRRGRPQQVSALGRWLRSKEMNESNLELRQPFSSSLSRLSLRTLSRSSEKEQRSVRQSHLSWVSGIPVNISFSLNKQWQLNSSGGQACAHLSSQNMKGCVSVSQEGNVFSQNAELRWNNKSVKQGVSYQKGVGGTHKLQLNVALDKASPGHCSSHSILTKILSNLRDGLEYSVLLGLCPSQPPLLWSGRHRLNSGEELFYTESGLSVTGRPDLCGFTLALTNTSTARGSDVTLFTESRMGNWSVEVRGSALSRPRGPALLIHTRLDRREEIWLNATSSESCFRTAAGYKNGSGPSEELSVLACLGKSSNLMLDVEKTIGGAQPETLASVSVGAASQRLTFAGRGCVESLTVIEARIRDVSSTIKNKLLERIKTIKHLLAEFRQQFRGDHLLRELNARALLVTQRAESLLEDEAWSWRALRSLRHVVVDALPRCLGLLRRASLQGQQELRRPLATLAAVYQDIKGQSLESVWREALVLWTRKLGRAFPAPLARGNVEDLGRAVDLVGQYTYHWMESKMAEALSGLRKQLASMYQYSPSECSTSASIRLPPLRWSRAAEVGAVSLLLEEWLLKPLQSLSSIRPSAEFYRLKRKIIGNPFIHQALLAEDRFVVTFDGHLYELPGRCPLILAQHTGIEPSFTLLLNSHPRNFLLLGLNNSTVAIRRDGQVEVECNRTVTNTWRSDDGVTVRRGSRTVHVSDGNGVSLSCDLRLRVCSWTLHGWLHGTSTGLLGTNDNEVGNDWLLRDASQAENKMEFFHSWQMKSECVRPPDTGAKRGVTCDFLFSSPDSPLSSCFRVVDPAQFSSTCRSSSFSAPCPLASAFVHLCRLNYVPLEVPFPCAEE
ncbi:uncharacterized protein LOC130929889 [Corythoichthys intestinalis]|uniref:uncharacterized protein LOC130929889 n=1 Tax=Corythoichthys intestinalis TaxID=161448 RepID=UPI0025A55790|nr:uncharacterized protein LOC130929889 [Corythoichthys intestinalis]